MQKLIQAKQGRHLLDKAIRHQNRLRFHTETNLSRFDAMAATEFLRWVESLIPPEKFAIFLSLFQFPVFTNDLVDSIYTELQRIFSGRNKAATYQFTDSKLRDDWEYYRQTFLKEPKIWECEGWEQMKSSINSVLIVDLPEVQTSTLPEPYFYWLDAEHILSFDYDKNKGRFSWIAFEQENGRVAFFDDQAFTIFQRNKKNEFDFVVQKLHNLRFCPVRWFWGESMSYKEPELKKAPISKQLSKLDWVLFFEISKHHLDLYAPYPIYSAYEQDCDYSNPETNEYCDGGFLKLPDGTYSFRTGTITRCPVCADNRMAGVGAMISVPQPTDKVDMRNPVNITTVDATSLKYNVDEVERLKKEIYLKCVGVGGEMSREAVNEKQVIAGFESKTSVLNALKQNFEEAQQWITDTVCLLRYGKAYISSSLSYGTDFYVSTIQDLYLQYSDAKKSGVSEIVLDGIHDKIVETENFNNPIELQRQLILKHLEPFRHNTKQEAIQMYRDGVITDLSDVLLKINFSLYVMRFERENTNIIEFGSALEFRKKIQIISETLKSYGKAEIEKRTEPLPA